MNMQMRTLFVVLFEGGMTQLVGSTLTWKAVTKNQLARYTAPLALTIFPVSNTMPRIQLFFHIESIVKHDAESDYNRL